MQRLLAPWPFLVLLAAAGCCGAPFHASRALSLTATWNQYERIDVRVRNGGVELRAEDVSDVQITGELRAGGLSLSEAEANLNQLEVYAGPDGDATLLIELRYPPALQNKNVGASLVIRVPQACAARVRTSNGTIEVAGMKDEVDVESSNGRIRIEDVTGAVRADTSNGAIELRNITGDVRAESSNGRIRGEQIVGNCEASTSNGAIECEVVPAAEGEVELHSSNGSIRLTLPAGLGADLDASTSNGRVKLELGDVPLKNVDVGRSHLRATMNAGGCRVLMRTSNGSITLTSR